ncbi:hypothetical protein Clacol_008461 [Clathrus columnatus]|uniref:BD-FAE-like domain-containing protein n=1 Tax=Clathrus columnatus TaxID=1419009 RepID=A0AAV5AND4_9AGAM|nr:hypothetical protein Clacol_008461 [Clathrus columnatus]
MEAISKITTTDFMEILGKTGDIFTPILEGRRAIIAETAKETFQFGPTERHKLDVYYPPEGTSNAPILFFVYGGGFVSGSRNRLPGIYFDNIGAFYAKRGVLTVIADYRLAPATQYPGPVEDIRDAIRFVLSSSEVNITAKGADVNQVFIMGHSAGATHTSTLFLNESILDDKDRANIKGTILVAGSYSGGPMSSPYYGEVDHFSKTPIGLLETKSLETIQKLLPPKVLILIGDLDPHLWETGLLFEAKLKEKGVQFDKEILKGHNHFSLEFCPSSGEGEEFAENIVTYIKGST